MVKNWAECEERNWKKRASAQLCCFVPLIRTATVNIISGCARCSRWQTGSTYGAHAKQCSKCNKLLAHSSSFKHHVRKLHLQNQKQQLCRPIGYETDILNFCTMDTEESISYSYSYSLWLRTTESCYSLSLGIRRVATLQYLGHQGVFWHNSLVWRTSIFRKKSVGWLLREPLLWSTTAAILEAATLELWGNCKFFIW